MGATAVVLALILIMATVALLAPVLPVGTLLTVMPTASVQTLSGHRRESLEMRSKIDAGNGSVLKTIHYNINLYYNTQGHSRFDKVTDSTMLSKQASK